MKIGILSQYYRRNYGGILQSYALFHVIQSMGHEVELIDFRYNDKANMTIQQWLRLFANKYIRHISKENLKSNLLTRKLPNEHVEAFSAFKKKYLRYSPPLNNSTIGMYISKYDAIIVGSDQVWNSIEGKRLYYFLDFGLPYHGKKIAYAPCSIITQVSSNAKKLSELLCGFNAISVRDKTTQKMVREVSGITPEIVLDPTLLYDFKEFEFPAIVEGEYIFSYILGSEISVGHSIVLNKIFEKYGRMKVVAAIIPDISLEVEKFADEIIYNASPNEWVNLIANAKFVYTDSFHGCVFSMKFHKQFFAYYRDNKRASRLIDLKVAYGLNNIQNSESSLSISEINYDEIDAKLSLNIVRSLDFLKNNLFRD